MGEIAKALPFWLSLALVPLVIAAAMGGGAWVLLVPAVAWWIFPMVDHLSGQAEANADPDTPDAALWWYRLVTLVWPPLQVALVLGLIWWATRSGMGLWEKVGLFFGVGVLSGTIGINYAHELLHQRNRWERWLADILLASVFYGHFRSEHLLVHHTHVGTPRDPVTARYNEGFHRFYPRVLRESLLSSIRAEAARLRRTGRSPWDRRNPFWRYGALQAGFAVLALGLGGPEGLGLLLVQAGTAIWQLELVNYVEHYGLTRKHLGQGRYEPVRPHHSWNACPRASNWLLINLQRHSDHHVRPDRRFPLLQAYAEDAAPRLPAGYMAMTALAMVPPLWRRVMNPRVRAWRKAHYPEVEDWGPYTRHATPVRAAA